MAMIVQSKYAVKGSGGTTIVVSLDAAPTNGNTLVAVISGYGAQWVSGVTSAGGTWVRATGVTAGASSTHTDCWILQNVSGGDGVVTLTQGNTGTEGMRLYELVGVPTTGEVVLGVLQQANGASTTLDTGSVTPTSGRVAVVLAIGTTSATTPNSGPTGSFTDPGTRAYQQSGAKLEVASTTGSYSTTWGIASSVVSAGLIIVIDGGSAGGGGGGSTPVSRGVFF